MAEGTMPELGKKEKRKVMNRITAKRSRERRNVYMRQLEEDFARANERIAELEMKLFMQEQQAVELRSELQNARGAVVSDPLLVWDE